MGENTIKNLLTDHVGLSARGHHRDADGKWVMVPVTTPKMSVIIGNTFILACDLAWAICKPLGRLVGKIYLAAMDALPESKYRIISEAGCYINDADGVSIIDN